MRKIALKLKYIKISQLVLNSRDKQSNLFFPLLNVPFAILKTHFHVAFSGNWREEKREKIMSDTHFPIFCHRFFLFLQFPEFKEKIFHGARDSKERIFPRPNIPSISRTNTF